MQLLILRASTNYVICVPNCMKHLVGYQIRIEFFDFQLVMVVFQLVQLPLLVPAEMTLLNFVVVVESVAVEKLLLLLIVADSYFACDRGLFIVEVVETLGDLDGS